MGMSYTGFGAPVTVKNLKVNADLNLGSYDLTATDVKGDTAEFDEFVGGVGNFTNVLGSGNLDIEGTGNVKGLTTFQNGVQVNGSLHVEGSINNVNIADNGEITTAQGVNGADFNGAKITTTKFNGATIDTSGNVTGAKGTFSGAVRGTSFNGIAIGTNAFDNMRVVPILSTSILGQRVYTCSNTSQAIFNMQPSVSVSNGTYTIGRPILSTNYPISVYDVPNNLTYELSVLFSDSVSCTVKISGSISKTLTFSSTSHVELNLTYNEVVNFIRKNTTLTISGLSGNTTLNAIKINATASNTTYVYLVY